MKREIWLRTNRRALAVTAIIPFAALVVGLAAVGTMTSTAAQLGGWLLALVSCLLLAAVGFAWRQPRLAYRDQQLQVYLRWDGPIRVPIEVVECFFLGHAPSLLPGRTTRRWSHSRQTAAVVVRLAESARDWHQVDVAAALGQWRDGYITLRGTWCEPLTADLVGQLNQRLIKAHRAVRKRSRAMAS